MRLRGWKFAYLLPCLGIRRWEEYKAIARVPIVILFFELDEGGAKSVKGGVSWGLAVRAVEENRVGDVAMFSSVVLGTLCARIMLLRAVSG